MIQPNAASIEAPQAPQDRILAGAAYLSTVTPGLFGWTPLVLYYWKRQGSQFLAFHAIQSLLLAISTIPGMFFIGYLTTVVVNAIDARGGRSAQAYSNFVWMTMFCVAISLPFTANIWMAVRVMRGRPGVLPLLGSLSKQIIGAKTPG
jgi:uncharacterized membrane protein